MSPPAAEDTRAKWDAFWRSECMRWRGRVLTGKHAHWCPDWDLLPIDETTPEWPCVCCRDGACGVPIDAT